MRDSVVIGPRGSGQVADVDIDTESTQIMRNGSWQKVRDDLQLFSRESRTGFLGSENPSPVKPEGTRNSGLAAQIARENDSGPYSANVTMIWDGSWHPASECPQQQQCRSRGEEQRAGDDQRRVSSKAGQDPRLSILSRKSCTLDTSLPTEQHAFLVWGFDEHGALVHRLKDGAPPGHGICVGDRLVAINGARVLDKRKDLIKQIWCTCLDDGYLLHLDLVADDYFGASR